MPRLASANALAAFIDSPADTRVRQVANAPVTDGTPSGGLLRTGDRTSTNILVPAGAIGLPKDAPGVYGVVVTLKVDGVTVWTRASPLTWQPAALPPLTVTAVATITGAESRVEGLLTAAADQRVSLLVDPTALTDEQRQSLEGRDAYMLPAANIDVSSAAHAETPALIEDALSRSRALSTLKWIAVAAATDASTVSTASKEGASAVLVDARWADIVAPAGGGSYDAGKIDGKATVPVVVANGPLSTTLASRSPADSTSTAWVMAQAAFEASAGAGSVVVAPGDGWGVEGTRPSRALGALLDAPFVTLALPLGGPGGVAERHHRASDYHGEVERRRRLRCGGRCFRPHPSRRPGQGDDGALEGDRGGGAGCAGVAFAVKQGRPAPTEPSKRRPPAKPRTRCWRPCPSPRGRGYSSCRRRVRCRSRWATTSTCPSSSGSR